MGRWSTPHVLTVSAGIVIIGLIGISLFVNSPGGISSDRSAVPHTQRSPSLTPITARDRYGTELVWVIADTISCRRPAYTLRRIQSTYGNRVELTVLRAGVSVAAANRILVRERLKGTVHSVDGEPYGEIFHPPFTTSIHILQGENVLASWSITDQRGPSFLKSKLEALLPSQ